MNAQAEETSKTFDVIKHGLSLIFVVAGVAGFYYFSEVPGFTLLYRVLALVAILLVALAIMFSTDLGRSGWEFALESKQEVRKVVWPTREETIRTTLLVFGLVIIVGLFLSLLDWASVSAIKTLTGQGS